MGVAVFADRALSGELWHLRSHRYHVGNLASAYDRASGDAGRFRCSQQPNRRRKFLRGNVWVCEGGTSLKRSPLPRAPSRRDVGGRNAGGRGRFSERSASPPRPLSPEERLAFKAVASSGLVPPERWMVLCCLVAVTVADRAAATCRRRGTIACIHLKLAGKGHRHMETVERRL